MQYDAAPHVSIEMHGLYSAFKEKHILICTIELEINSFYNDNGTSTTQRSI